MGGWYCGVGDGRGVLVLMRSMWILDSAASAVGQPHTEGLLTIVCGAAMLGIQAKVTLATGAISMISFHDR